MEDKNTNDKVSPSALPTYVSISSTFCLQKQPGNNDLRRVRTHERGSKTMSPSSNNDTLDAYKGRTQQMDYVD